jgi:hypothetical protein
MVKVKSVLSLVWQALQGVPYYFTSYSRTVRSTIDCLSAAFFQKRFSRSEVPDMSIDSLQLWNCFSYYPAVTTFDFLGGQRGKFLDKSKKFLEAEYCFTVDWASPESNILDTDHS